MAGVTVDVEGAGAKLPAGLEGGGTVVVVKYDEPPAFAASPDQPVGTACVRITLDRPLADLPESDPVAKCQILQMSNF